MYALTDCPFLWHVDPVTLETIGESVNMTDLIGAHLVAAHPHTGLTFEYFPLVVKDYCTCKDSLTLHRPNTVCIE